MALQPPLEPVKMSETKAEVPKSEDAKAEEEVPKSEETKSEEPKKIQVPVDPSQPVAKASAITKAVASKAQAPAFVEFLQNGIVPKAAAERHKIQIPDGLKDQVPSQIQFGDPNPDPQSTARPNTRGNFMNARIGDREFKVPVPPAPPAPPPPLMNYDNALTHCVFVRNLASSLTEIKLKEVFRTCGEVKSVSFHMFPGSNQVYAQVNLTTSAAVQKALAKDKEQVLGVPMTVEIKDPQTVTTTKISAISKSSSVQAVIPRAQGGGLAPPETPSTCVVGVPMLGSHQGYAHNPQLVQARLQLQRTVYLAPVPPEVSKDVLGVFCEAFGPVTAMRIDTNTEKVRFALVEFQLQEAAEMMLKMPYHRMGETKVAVKLSEACVEEKPLMFEEQKYSQEVRENSDNYNRVLGVISHLSINKGKDLGPAPRSRWDKPIAGIDEDNKWDDDRKERRRRRNKHGFDDLPTRDRARRGPETSDESSSSDFEERYGKEAKKKRKEERKRRKKEGKEEFYSSKDGNEAEDKRKFWAARYITEKADEYKSKLDGRKTRDGDNDRNDKNDRNGDDRNGRRGGKGKGNGKHYRGSDGYYDDYYQGDYVSYPTEQKVAAYPEDKAPTEEYDRVGQKKAPDGGFEDAPFSLRRNHYSNWYLRDGSRNDGYHGIVLFLIKAYRALG